MVQLKVDIFGDKQLALYLGRVSQSMKPSLQSGLGEVGRHLRDEAKKRLGSYQRGWAKLKRATVVAKQRRRGGLVGSRRAGLSKLVSSVNSSLNGDEPLVLDGKLKNSINYEVNMDSMNTVVYSDNPYAAVHEYGYAPKNVPARSYMRLTLWEEEDTVKKIISNRVGRILNTASGAGDL